MSLSSRYTWQIKAFLEEHARMVIETILFSGCVHEIKKIRENGHEPATFQVETIEINFEENNDIQERDLIKNGCDVIVEVDGIEYEANFCWVTQ